MTADDQIAQMPQHKAEIPARPADVPSDLLAMSPDSAVEFMRFNMAGPMRAGDVVERFREIIRRQERGEFELREAAQILADEHGLDAGFLLGRMVEAVTHKNPLRRLTVYGGDTRMVRELAEEVRARADYVRVDGLRAWLAAIGDGVTFPDKPEAAATPASAAPEAAEPPAAPTPAPSASAPTVAAPEPAQKQKKPRRSWWNEVVSYLAGLLRDGKHRTAKELHRAAEKLAGADGSPFEIVDRELRAREFGRAVAVKTLQNRWAEVKAAAGMQ